MLDWALNRSVIDDEGILQFDSFSAFGVITQEYVFYQKQGLNFLSG